MVTKSKGPEIIDYPAGQSSSYYLYMIGRKPTVNDIPALPPALFNQQSCNSATITYENGYQRFNPCDHTHDKLKIASGRSPCISWKPKDGNGNYWWIWACGCNTAPQYPVSPGVYQVTEDMRKRAWHAMYPELNTGFSLANFLWELKDFAHLLRTIRNLKKLAKALDPALFGSKTAADLHLSYQFGIKLFIQDVWKLYGMANSLEKAISDFKRKGQKANNYHYTEVLGSSESVGQYGTGTVTYAAKAKYNATLRCTYDYKVPSLFEGWRRLYGLRITPEAIWDAIPFSFVVDWLFKIGNSLDQFDEDARVVISVIAYCDSIKSETSTYFKRGGDHIEGYSAPDSSGPLWEWKRTHYSRTPGVPNTGYALPVFDSLSKRELVLGAALLRTRN